MEAHVHGMNELDVTCIAFQYGMGSMEMLPRHHALFAIEYNCNDACESKHGFSTILHAA